MPPTKDEKLGSPGPTVTLAPPDVPPGEIEDAIEAEVELAKKPIPLEVVAVAPATSAGIVRLTVTGQRALDESLEGARAWWPRQGESGGTAEVLAVAPGLDRLDLWRLNAPAPPVGRPIFLYQPLYLEALGRAWREPAWARACVQAGERADERLPWDVVPAGFPKLRARQRDAWRLLDHRRGFLHGPPGTGKTTTLGALVASALTQRPGSRILLLSTTNGAVDEALLSVDRALVHLGQSETRAQAKRIGVHFEAGRYAAHPHLLPPVDRELVRRKAELERTRPPGTDAAALARWKEQLAAVQKGLRQHLVRVASEARLLAMTTTHAAFVLDVLRELPPFDLEVVDEASQVSQAHALALAPLGERVLYAGDPRQLGPVVQSEHPMAVRWLRSSMFRWAPGGDASVQLDEQSRMAPAIGTLVSEVFYDGQLRVAADALASPRWHEQRALPTDSPALASPLLLEPVHLGPGEGPAPRGGSAERLGSARRLVERVAAIVASGVDQADVLVLTPFRAQRALLENLLDARKLDRVTVSTVHRAQGRERHTVLYDPVDGSAPFLQGDEARRLLNVALSRAQARLVLFLSPADRAGNALLDQIGRAAEHLGSALPRQTTDLSWSPLAGVFGHIASGTSGQSTKAPRVTRDEAAPPGPPSLLEVLGRPGFPEKCHGLEVDHKGRRLRIDARASRDGRLACLDLASGQVRRYDLAALRGAAGRS